MTITYSLFDLSLYGQSRTDIFSRLAATMELVTFHLYLKLEVKIRRKKTKHENIIKQLGVQVGSIGFMEHLVAPTVLVVKIGSMIIEFYKEFTFCYLGKKSIVFPWHVLKMFDLHFRFKRKNSLFHRYFFQMSRSL